MSNKSHRLLEKNEKRIESLTERESISVTGGKVIFNGYANIWFKSKELFKKPNNDPIVYTWGKGQENVALVVGMCIQPQAIGDCGWKVCESFPKDRLD